MSKTQTRIQLKNNAAILAAGLNVFSQFGFRGSTLDQIAKEAGLSKPNLIYYFASKDAIYRALLDQLLEDWLEPIYTIDEDGDPVAEITAYAKRKLAMSQHYPRESRLFANEVIQGAPQIGDTLRGELRRVVGRLVGAIERWIQEGKIRPVEPHHLIFSIWSITQHYADFDVQVRAILKDTDPFPGAETHLEEMLHRMLSIDTG
ncbi:TetR family transcriptional regulator C-terminal domain-containing protein [Roseobacter sp.]|uniref:TetR family transcriptional regulator C-terminal domain-containing protein n=1 Tax=Roseobacter sp. TaxID=1907202 RepID=UPI003299D736